MKKVAKNYFALASKNYFPNFVAKHHLEKIVQLNKKILLRKISVIRKLKHFLLWSTHRCFFSFIEFGNTTNVTRLHIDIGDADTDISVEFGD